LELPLNDFLKKFPFASERIIAMHFNVLYSTVNDIFSRELGLRNFSRRWIQHQLSDPQKKFRRETSVELLALLDQYSELEFEGIATGDKSWVFYLIESDSTFARRGEEVIAGLRPGISIKRVMIAVFFTARQLSALDALPNGQKYNQEYFVQDILPSLLTETERFAR
jgi:hypothetical protein